MLSLPPQVRVFVCTRPTDLRKSFDGLSGLVVYRYDAPLFFANARRFDEHVHALMASRPAVRAIVLDASAITGIDASGVHALRELDRDLADAGVALHLATVRGPTRDALARGGVWDGLVDRVHPSVAAACAATAPGSLICDIQPGEAADDGHVL